MDALLPLALSLVLTRQDLRFAPLSEQLGPRSCGYALAAALLGRDETVLAPPGEGPASFGDIAAMLGEAGIATRALRLEQDSLDALLARGLSPLIVHYSKGEGHFALLLGREKNIYELGDPARGLELLEASDFAARWSGAVLALDPRSLAPGFLTASEEALRRAWNRRALLSELALSEEGRAAERRGVASSAGGAGALCLSGRAGLVDQGPSFRILGDLGFDFRAGSLSLGLILPFDGDPSVESASLAAGPGLSFALAADLAPWFLGFFLDIGAASLEARMTKEVSGPGGAGLGIELSRLADPLVLGLLAAVKAGRASGGLAWELTAAATEALNEGIYVRFEAGLRGSIAGRGRPVFGEKFGLCLGARVGDWRLAVGRLDLGVCRPFMLEGELDLPLAY